NTPEKTATSRPARCDLNSVSTGNCASALSVTTSGRFRPFDWRCCATSLRAPGPKRMAVGKEKPVMLMRVPSGEFQGHVVLGEVAAVDLDRARLDAERAKADAFVERCRRAVALGDGEHEQFEPLVARLG